MRAEHPAIAGLPGLTGEVLPRAMAARLRDTQLPIHRRQAQLLRHPVMLTEKRP